MKNIFLTVSLFTSLTTFSAEKELLISCSTAFSTPGKSKEPEMKIDVYRTNSYLEASITQEIRDVPVTYEEEVQVENFKVREGLSSDMDSDTENLNLAERLIVRALFLTEDSIFAETTSAGLDLRKIHSATVYNTGRVDSGLIAIIQAKDESGSELGSFLAGLQVSLCK